MKKIGLLLFSTGLLFSLGLLVGCSDDEVFVSVQEQLLLDIEMIDQYLADNNITTAIVDENSGIRYVIDVEGTGDNPDLSSFVTVTYEGRLMSNEQVFDANEEVDFFLTGVIPGWQIGIPFFKEGGSGTLYIPSGWAYGKNGTTGIPGNSILIFDVELIEIN